MGWKARTGGWLQGPWCPSMALGVAAGSRGTGRLFCTEKEEKKPSGSKAPASSSPEQDRRGGGSGAQSPHPGPEQHAVCMQVTVDGRSTRRDRSCGKTRQRAVEDRRRGLTVGHYSVGLRTLRSAGLESEDSRQPQQGLKEAPEI